MSLVFTSLLLVLLVRPTGSLAWVARTRVLRELGMVSYCMYLIHDAVNFVCHFLLLRNSPQISNWPGVLTTLLAAVVTYGIAKLSWIAFEGPLLRYGHRFRYAESRETDQSVGEAASVFDSGRVSV